jgi:hypothetical protein
MLGLMPDEEPTPDPLAFLDQALAGLSTRAQVIRAYYQALLERGFSEEQAFTLTRDYAAKWSI